MKVGLHTVDLFPGRERLMPFRTVLEVAKVMKAQGWEADVINSSVSEHNAKDFTWHGVDVVQSHRDFARLSAWVNERGYDVFFFAATIREGLRSLDGFRSMVCKKIAYVPSGITPKRNALFLLNRHGWYAKAWIFEAFTPKGLLGRKLKAVGFTDIIGLTDYTTRKVSRYLKGHTIYPGKDDFEKIVPDDTFVQMHGLKSSKYYLYTGGPAQSRGGKELLEAFDKMADNTVDARLVFLMRQDVGGENGTLLHTIGNLRNKDKVLVLTDKLTVAQLKAYFVNAYAVVLPFICIPAEIPITYYEVMSCGTPIISFPNAGTTEYLRKGLWLSNGVSVQGLCKAMEDCWNNKQERDIKGVSALGRMSNHPYWEQVGLEWMKIVENS